MRYIEQQSNKEATFENVHARNLEVQATMIDRSFVSKMCPEHRSLPRAHGRRTKIRASVKQEDIVVEVANRDSLARCCQRAHKCLAKESAPVAPPVTRKEAQPTLGRPTVAPQRANTCSLRCTSPTPTSIHTGAPRGGEMAGLHWGCEVPPTQWMSSYGKVLSRLTYRRRPEALGILRRRATHDTTRSRVAVPTLSPRQSGNFEEITTTAGRQ